MATIFIAIANTEAGVIPVSFDHFPSYDFKGNVWVPMSSHSNA